MGYKKRKTPFQNERVSIKIEKNHGMIRGSFAESIGFNRENQQFQRRKLLVSSGGTSCFKRWNRKFHALKHFVPYRETSDKR